MPVSGIILKLAIGLLMLDALLEMALISSMVAWLHRRAGRSFEIDYNGSSFSLHGKPFGLLVDQGHTSNGAAGTAFVLVGLGGILVMALRNRSDSRTGRALYNLWLCKYSKRSVGVCIVRYHSSLMAECSMPIPKPSMHNHSYLREIPCKVANTLYWTSRYDCPLRAFDSCGHHLYFSSHLSALASKN